MSQKSGSDHVFWYQGFNPRQYPAKNKALSCFLADEVSEVLHAVEDVMGTSFLNRGQTTFIGFKAPA